MHKSKKSSTFAQNLMIIHYLNIAIRIGLLIVIALLIKRIWKKNSQM